MLEPWDTPKYLREKLACFKTIRRYYLQQIKILTESFAHPDRYSEHKKTETYFNLLFFSEKS
jgi:hypothetical protein